MQSRREVLLMNRAMYMYVYFHAVFMHESELNAQRWRHQKWLVEGLAKEKKGE